MGRGELPPILFSGEENVEGGKAGSDLHLRYVCVHWKGVKKGEERSVVCCSSHFVQKMNGGECELIEAIEQGVWISKRTLLGWVDKQRPNKWTRLYKDREPRKLIKKSDCCSHQSSSAEDLLQQGATEREGACGRCHAL
ncbi:hypothetical protein CEXT_639111 [Caerostris extrusa]|uniref:Uncharacterized protein n=1 Tax=Caerostris extrusa TaxID=172846 RepID=A0AAV4WL30_CAEEX|nr:hypothetical protein CEXT_639111 [Caerostris extrusa]